MPLQVELTDEETRCLHGYFERVDETDDLSFRHPGEFLAFQRIASQICRASAAKVAHNYAKLLTLARTFVARSTAPRRALATSDAIGCGANGMSAQAIGTEMHDVIQSNELEHCSGHSVDLSVAVSARAIVDACVTAFDERDAQTLIALFTDDARVFTPFFGYQSVSRFLADLFGSHSRAKLTQHGIVTNVEGRPQALGYFLLGDGIAHGDIDAMTGSDVFYYVMNLDSAALAIQSMIVLDA